MIKPCVNNAGFLFYTHLGNYLDTALLKLNRYH